MDSKIKITKKNEFLELDDALEKIRIIAEENCNATIIAKIMKNKTVEIECKKNSKIDFLSLQDCNSKSAVKIKKSAVAGDNAEINWFDCHFGGKLCDSETKTFLNGENSASSSTCLFFGNESQQFNFSFQNFHGGKMAKSSILIRGVLDDFANASCRNLLNVSKSANDSDGIQKSEILLLSKNSKANVLPELKIDNNVKRCSHGVSIGGVDSEKLFYLMSRGFSKKDGIKQVIEGFFSSALSGTNSVFAAAIKNSAGKKLK